MDSYLVSSNSSSNQSGFTLLECIFTLTIFIIIATLSYPSLVSTLADTEAKRIKREFFHSIRIGKVVSFSHRKQVLMCLLDEKGTCNRNGQKEIVLFFDYNNSKTYEPNIDTLVEIHALNLRYAEIKLRASAKRHYVRFASDSGAPRGFIGHFKYCPTKDYNKNMYKLSFNMVGGIKFKPNSAKEPTKC